MIKKIVIVGLFLGGGYFLIKRILPKNTYKAEKLELKSEQSANDVFEKEKRESEKKQMELQNKITFTGLHNLMYFGNRPTR